MATRVRRRRADRSHPRRQALAYAVRAHVGRRRVLALPDDVLDDRPHATGLCVRPSGRGRDVRTCGRGRAGRGPRSPHRSRRCDHPRGVRAMELAVRWRTTRDARHGSGRVTARAGRSHAWILAARRAHRGHRRGACRRDRTLVAHGRCEHRCRASVHLVGRIRASWSRRAGARHRRGARRRPAAHAGQPRKQPPRVWAARRSNTIDRSSRRPRGVARERREPASPVHRREQVTAVPLRRRCRGHARRARTHVAGHDHPRLVLRHRRLEHGELQRGRHP
ncbi:unannotated protein [freshwater metagenome]|uniref:Unannotated protein n=1 Tax=freshwater metagenome TaxID=449393 RepID=A0A6J7AQU7_9ZZZZ